MRNFRCGSPVSPLWPSTHQHRDRLTPQRESKGQGNVSETIFTCQVPNLVSQLHIHESVSPLSWQALTNQVEDDNGVENNAMIRGVRARLVTMGSSRADFWLRRQLDLEAIPTSDSAAHSYLSAQRTALWGSRGIDQIKI